MKKTLSALLAALLLVLCAGCGETEEPSGVYYDITGIPPKETVMTVDGNEIPAQMYFYWTAYNSSYLEYQMNMYNYVYGLYGEYINEDGTMNWDSQFTEDQTLSQYVKAETDNTVRFYAVMENLASELGAGLTEEDEAAIAGDRASSVEEMGGEEEFNKYLAEMGIDEDTFARFSATNYLFENLTDLVLQEGSELYLPAEGYDQYATYADHILLSTQDAETGAALSEEEIAAKRQTAEDLLAQLQASDDVVTLFGQLADEYSEDPGRASSPDGYIYTPGTMVTVFEDAAAALAPGEISGIVESDYGYHIILRKDLSEGLDDDADMKRSLARQHLQGFLEERMDQAEVTISEKLDGIDAGAFYTEYLTALDALEEPAGVASDGGTEGQETGGSADGDEIETGTDNAAEETDGGESTVTEETEG